MSDTDNRVEDEKIEPAAFRSRSADDEHQVISAATFNRGSTDSQNRPSGRGSHVQAKLVWAALAVLGMIAVALFGLLPDAVNSPPRDSQQASGPVQKSPSQPVASIPSVSQAQDPAPAPWQTAQVLRQKEDAEALIEQFVRLQMELEDTEVMLWGAEQFQQAIKLAQDGDGQFSQRDFLAAAASYEQGLTLLRALEGGIGAILDNTLAEGTQALLNYDAVGARKAFELALILEPNHPLASSGLARAMHLQEVAEFIELASQSERQGELEQARGYLVQARELDGQDQVVATSLQRISGMIRDRQFDTLMSRGYSSLDAGDAKAAVRDFDGAAKIRPNSSEVKDALAQAESIRRLDRIAQLQSEAARLEGEEEWSRAAERYDTALSLDDSLVFAKDGAQRARERAALDERMRSYIQQPERLQADAVYQAAGQVLQIARSIDPRTSILGQQITALEKAMVQSRQTVQVRFESDNETQVILAKVGPLGVFTEREVALRPGTYVATGSRNGYRDVRKTFVVGPGSQTMSVQVRCEEKI
jgi:tetratricopeptide (TPR) repeat protein